MIEATSKRNQRLNRMTKFRSIYMGAPADIARGVRGEVANAALISHSRQFARALHRVTDRVHCHVGSCLGNSTMVLGRTGNIVIDTGDCVEQSAMQQQDFRAVSDRPVSALIYTHSHYAMGSRTYVPQEREGQVPVWAHKDMMRTLARTLSDVQAALTRRASIQFGLYLPDQGEDAMPSHGIGPFLFELDKYQPTTGFVRPTNLVGDGDEAEIDGVRFQFFDAPGDTYDSLLIWLPEEGIAVNNVAWPALFNIYTLRGETFRNPADLVRGLDQLLAMRPRHLVGVHGLPISGEKEIRRCVTDYRDAIQYLYDQTVRGINLGMSADELVDYVRLPEALAQSRLTREFYGEASFHVRQIYHGLMGWFGNDTVELHRVPPDDRAVRMVALAGGPQYMQASVEQALERQEYAWAAELAGYLVRAYPECAHYRQLKARGLRAMGQATSAANSRAWYLTQARELEGSADTSRIPVNFVNAALVAQFPPQTYVNALRFRLDPALSGAGASSVDLRFTDVGFACRLLLRNGVVVLAPVDDASPDAGIDMSFSLWASLVGGEAKADEVAESEAVRLTGDARLGRAVLDAAQGK
ncbi:alkyl sulfatase dimerization domain-containing protein [Cupriavidus nantongensis]